MKNLQNELFCKAIQIPSNPLEPGVTKSITVEELPCGGYLISGKTFRSDGDGIAGRISLSTIGTRILYEVLKQVFQSTKTEE